LWEYNTANNVFPECFRIVYGSRMKTALTEGRLRSISTPLRSDVFVWDTRVPGFGVRLYSGGKRVYFIQYRVGGGRAARQRRLTLGEMGVLSLDAARDLARQRLGEVAAGRDPQGERRESSRQEAARLDRAIDAYEASLARRGVVNHKDIASTLRRQLLAPLGKVDIANIDRRSVAKRVELLEEVGKPGAAQDIRSKASTFLNWAVNQGLARSNPLAGWRQQRRTRHERSAKVGRSLNADELRAVWEACAECPPPFGDYVRLLLLLGQRRSETAQMRWSDIQTEQGAWVIPAGVAKNGRQHSVPLPSTAVEIIKRQPRIAGSPYVFAGRDGKVMSGWTQRVRGLIKKSGVLFTLHDCRRTFRSGLTALGVVAGVAELMLNHTRSDLEEIYDREPRWSERQIAAQRWSDHVETLI